MSPSPLDLVVLVPGKDDKAVLETLLIKRYKSLSIRKIDAKVITSPQRDPGCFHSAAAMLDGFQSECAHALVIFDYEGCGQEHMLRPDQVESTVRTNLALSGWDDRANVVVIEPELEIWMWSLSPSVDDVFGWSGKNPGLRQWMQQQGFIGSNDVKPRRPKEAMELALKVSRVRKSSANFIKLSERISLGRCVDPSFRKLVSILQDWFCE
jgi:hypothetical protein